MIVLDNIPVKIGLNDVVKKTRIRNMNEDFANVIQELLDMIHTIAKPKAIYEISKIDNKRGDSLDIGGVRFTSHILRVNLDKVGEVYPHVATCGTEIDEIVPHHDVMRYYFMDQIKEIVSSLALNYLQEHIRSNHDCWQTARMAPGDGSEDIWPITQQKELFSIFGNTEELIGVRLNSTYLMVPLKSVSGIIYQTETKFETCQLCPRKDCIERRAIYEPDFVRKYKEMINKD